MPARKKSTARKAAPATEFKKNDKVSFDTTKPILAAEHWTKDQLTARQTDLVERAGRIWSLGG